MLIERVGLDILWLVAKRTLLGGRVLLARLLVLVVALVLVVNVTAVVVADVRRVVQLVEIVEEDLASSQMSVELRLDIPLVAEATQSLLIPVVLA